MDGTGWWNVESAAGLKLFPGGMIKITMVILMLKTGPSVTSAKYENPALKIPKIEIGL